MSSIVNPLVFREYDIRGVATIDLSDKFAEDLGFAYAMLIKGNKPAAARDKLTIAVGKDCRLTSDAYERSLVNGLLKGGLNVIRLGFCPTPLTYFSTFHFDLDGAIMVTASHNPPDHNGFKICVGKDSIFGDEIQRLSRIMESENKNEDSFLKGCIFEVDIVSAYLNFQKRQFSSFKGKKIVIDCGNGMASIMVASKLFSSLGVEVLELFCEMDGTFPNHVPDPSDDRNLVDLIRTVKETHADFGIGFDGDADRIGVVDENGRLIPGDELLIIYSRSLLKTNPKAMIVSEVKSSSRLFDDIAKHGGKSIMWKVGHSHLKAKMKEVNAMLGGELSGHICFFDRYFGFDDAIYAALRLIEISIQEKGTLSSQLNDLPLIYNTPELRIKIEDSLKFKFVAMVKDILLKDPDLYPYHFTEIDGLRIDFGDGWGLIRASNTQSVITIRFEAITKKRLIEIENLFENAINSICKENSINPIKIE